MNNNCNSGHVKFIAISSLTNSLYYFFLILIIFSIPFNQSFGAMVVESNTGPKRNETNTHTEFSKDKDTKKNVPIEISSNNISLDYKIINYKLSLNSNACIPNNLPDPEHTYRLTYDLTETTSQQKQLVISFAASFSALRTSVDQPYTYYLPLVKLKEQVKQRCWIGEPRTMNYSHHNVTYQFLLSNTDNNEEVKLSSAECVDAKKITIIEGEQKEKPLPSAIDFSYSWSGNTGDKTSLDIELIPNQLLNHLLNTPQQELSSLPILKYHPFLQKYYITISHVVVADNNNIAIVLEPKHKQPKQYESTDTIKSSIMYSHISTGNTVELSRWGNKLLIPCQRKDINQKISFTLSCEKFSLIQTVGSFFLDPFQTLLHPKIRGIDPEIQPTTFMTNALWRYSPMTAAGLESIKWLGSKIVNQRNSFQKFRLQKKETDKTQENLKTDKTNLNTPLTRMPGTNAKTACVESVLKTKQSPQPNPMEHITPTVTTPTFNLADETSDKNANGVGIDVDIDADTDADEEMNMTLFTNDGTVNIILTEGAITWEYSLDGGISWNDGGTDDSFKLTDKTTYAAGEIQIRQANANGNISEPVSNPKAIEVNISVNVSSLPITNDMRVSRVYGITNRNNTFLSPLLLISLLAIKVSISQGANHNVIHLIDGGNSTHTTILIPFGEICTSSNIQLLTNIKQKLCDKFCLSNYDKHNTCTKAKIQIDHGFDNDKLVNHECYITTDDKTGKKYLTQSSPSIPDGVTCLVSYIKKNCADLKNKGLAKLDDSEMAFCNICNASIDKADHCDISEIPNTCRSLKNIILARLEVFKTDAGRQSLTKGHQNFCSHVCDIRQDPEERCTLNPTETEYICRELRAENGRLQTELSVEQEAFCTKECNIRENPDEHCTLNDGQTAALCKKLRFKTDPLNPQQKKFCNNICKKKQQKHHCNLKEDEIISVCEKHITDKYSEDSSLTAIQIKFCIRVCNRRENSAQHCLQTSEQIEATCENYRANAHSAETKLKPSQADFCSRVCNKKENSVHHCQYNSEQFRATCNNYKTINHSPDGTLTSSQTNFCTKVCDKLGNSELHCSQTPEQIKATCDKYRIIKNSPHKRLTPSQNNFCTRVCDGMEDSMQHCTQTPKLIEKICDDNRIMGGYNGSIPLTDYQQNFCSEVCDTNKDPKQHCTYTQELIDSVCEDIRTDTYTPSGSTPNSGSDRQLEFCKTKCNMNTDITKRCYLKPEQTIEVCRRYRAIKYNLEKKTLTPSQDRYCTNVCGNPGTIAAQPCTVSPEKIEPVCTQLRIVQNSVIAFKTLLADQIRFCHDVCDQNPDPVKRCTYTSEQIGCIDSSIEGANYDGQVSWTNEGESCAQWTDAINENPNLKGHNSLHFPGIEDVKDNYCRSPTHIPHGPWCYILQHGNYRVKGCEMNIPYCTRNKPSTKENCKLLRVRNNFVNIATNLPYSTLSGKQRDYCFKHCDTDKDAGFHCFIKSSTLGCSFKNSMQNNDYQQDFQGVVNWNNKGVFCRNWDVNTDGNIDTGNFCRNPDNSKYGAWCYVATHNGTLAMKSSCSEQIPSCNPPTSIPVPGSEAVAIASIGSLAIAGGVGVCVAGAAVYVTYQKLRYGKSCLESLSYLKNFCCFVECNQPAEPDPCVEMDPLNEKKTEAVASADEEV